jgi:hypothetical protein
VNSRLTPSRKSDLSQRGWKVSVISESRKTLTS